MTAAELYEIDPEFRALVASWVADRRCPYGLGDFLEERGLVSQADCCRWCAVQPDKRIREPDRGAGERGGRCGPFPTYNTNGKGEWFWFGTSLPLGDEEPYFVPDENVGRDYNPIDGTSPTAAILALLDFWKPKDAPHDPKATAAPRKFMR